MSNQGASEAEIQEHYDVGNAFYSLWLGDSMSYTAALWRTLDESDDDTLDKAQARKINYHIQAANAKNCNRVLDIGCGWGGVLSELVKKHKVHEAVGLTLSQEQVDWINSHHSQGISAKLECWQDHHSDEQYDAIISIGAFEHFARPEMTRDEKISSYRHFFSRCEKWLQPGGRLSLQTIAHGCVPLEKRAQTDSLSERVFPGSALPTLREIIQAADGVLQVKSVLEHGNHYQRTLKQWHENLFRQRKQAMALHGDETFRHFKRYLQNAEMGFLMGNLALYRVVLEKPKELFGRS